MRNHWKIARAWCDDNGVNGPCVQLKYPGHEGATSSKEQYIEYLQAIAPYCPGTYQIACNEVLRTNNQEGSDDLLNILGGPGATGYDGLIALIKLQRQYLPGVLLGLNEYSVCDLSNGGNPAQYTYMEVCKKAYKILHDNGAALDWFGAEGYWGNYTTGPSGQPEPLSAQQAAIDNLGAAILPYLTGVCGKPCIAFTEFTPGGWYCDTTGHPVIGKNQKECWQKYLGMFANDAYTFGVTGPWESQRRSFKFGSDWFYDDTNNGGTDPDCAPSSNGHVTATLTWLQGWVPANVHN